MFFGNRALRTAVPVVGEWLRLDPFRARSSPSRRTSGRDGTYLPLCRTISCATCVRCSHAQVGIAANLQILERADPRPYLSALSFSSPLTPEPLYSVGCKSCRTAIPTRPGRTAVRWNSLSYISRTSSRQPKGLSLPEIMDHVLPDVPRCYWRLARISTPINSPGNVCWRKRRSDFESNSISYGRCSAYASSNPACLGPACGSNRGLWSRGQPPTRQSRMAVRTGRDPLCRSRLAEAKIQLLLLNQVRPSTKAAVISATHLFKVATRDTVLATLKIPNDNLPNIA